MCEKNDRVGGLLRYGIPDFKLDKGLIDRRAKQLEAEGVKFRTSVLIGDWPKDSKVTNWSKETISADQLKKEFDAVLLTGGSEQSRDLPVTGRELDGVHFAMEFLPQQNKVNAGDKLKDQIRADGKHVIVIGGGDTGSDCVGTSTRHGAKSVTQFEVMPMPPEQENKPLVWPYWPLKLRTSSSHDESAELGLLKREFAISTKEFIGKNGKLTGLKTVHVEMKEGIRCRKRQPWQCQGQCRSGGWLCHQCRQSVCRWRYPPWPILGGVGHSRGTSSRTGGG